MENYLFLTTQNESGVLSPAAMTIIAMLLLGIPLLQMEIALARRVRQGAPGTMRAVHKKAEPIGWVSVMS